MSDQLILNEYKQQIADWYSSRSHTYDHGDWHPRIAHRLIEHAQIKPGQFPNPMTQLSSEQLAQARAEVNAELEALVTEQGIWNDITIFFVFGRKPTECIF